jgi:predicted Zn-dependent peptidase
MYGPRDDSGPDAVGYALLESEYHRDELLDLPALSHAWLAVTLAQVNAVARRYYRPDLLKVVAMGAIPAAPQKPIFAPGTFRALFDR